ncbi:hypothetical protein GWI33_022947 [Rhynchophorus ferrugineus]|uniref:Uncharacterized protein n=1 Tax=Rhynchophorus ferrugineus TaxID=354439 RepID=A0A834HPJ4_RHYFE|nr:hypothetical protein GWI33_022947 [Rhynchophorus ferrugineus]
MNKHEIERERDDRYQPASDRPDVTARVSGSEVDDDGHGGVRRGGSGGASPSPLSVDRDDDDDDDDGTETYGAIEDGAAGRTRRTSGRGEEERAVEVQALLEHHNCGKISALPWEIFFKVWDLLFRLAQGYGMDGDCPHQY